MSPDLGLVYGDILTGTYRKVLTLQTAEDGAYDLQIGFKGEDSGVINIVCGDYEGGNYVYATAEDDMFKDPSNYFIVTLHAEVDTTEILTKYKDLTVNALGIK